MDLDLHNFIVLSYESSFCFVLRYANWIFDPDRIRMQDVRMVISYLSKRPLGRMISLHLLMTKWDKLNEQ